MKQRRNMTHVSQGKKRWVSAGLFFIFSFSFVLSLIFANRVYAQEMGPPFAASALAGAQAEAACDAAPLSPPCVARSVKETASILGDRFISPTFRIALVQGLLNISQFVVNRLAYEAALVVANGGPGQSSLFYGKSAKEGFEQFGLEVAGEAVAELSDAFNTGLGTKFDFCAPSGSLFSLSLKLGVVQKYQPEPPRCDIMEVINNWDSFVSDAYSSVTDPEKVHSAIVSKFAESLQPGRNELSAAITFNLKVEEEVEQKKQLEIEERLAQNLKDVKDRVTKQTKTPNKVVENDFLDKIKKAVTGETTQLKASEIGSFGDAMGGLALTAASTFTNTLLSQLFNKIYSGLFDTQPDSKDPFNVEAIAETNQDPKALSRVFATTPFATADYNALTEFVVCPPQGVANRGLNNCVMDSSFLSAISRGSSGVPLTVQEAIDEGLLNGGWSIISPKDLSVNQDPLCYTYGFCYSNLVKLRKARVLPIGWELAALRNSVSSPKTLQEVINEFNNCNQYGGIDAQHPFCHLIDPNWVLKYPDTQCRATVNSEIRLTALSPGRQSVCADSQSCLGENSKGECVDGYGYCVREKNVWRFRGDECPAHYAGCLALRSTTTQQQQALIINTVDFSVCNQANAGCQWYRTTKNLNTADTPANQADDSYDWLLPSETYLTADREDDWKYQKTDGTVTPSTYSYQERVYFTRSAQACSQSDAGCSQLNPAQGAVLNSVRNPSFEQDEDKDGVPDDWFLEDLLNDEISIEVNKPAARGTSSLKMLTSLNSNGKLIQHIPVRENQFYTLSYFAVSDTGAPTYIDQKIQVFDAGGNQKSLVGYSLFGCSVTGGNEIYISKSAEQEWKRFSCTFSVPPGSKQIKLGFVTSTNVRYDGIQLEATEVMSDFKEGFSNGDEPQKTIKVAPAYLNCTGASTDPAACVQYAQMCQAQDVGCSLFTPDDGDPALPAIVSSLDSCPAECVGYDTYKQEQTAYESEKFPLYFIPTKTKACSAQFVGCDSFTNLSSAAEGGEGIEYYTNLRACATEAMADGAFNKQKATFYTWEGSDNAGYQLRSWELLESDLSDTEDMDITSAPSIGPGTPYQEKQIGKAPCTKWDNVDKDEIVCIDNALDDDDPDSLSHKQEIQSNVTCADHDDILTNPDCREFYDADGFVHYREFSKTVTISNACKPYRKDQSTQDDCDAAGGYWDGQVGFCRYFGLSVESNVCPAVANGCRAYTGGAGRNSATLFSETFENGSYEGFLPWNDPVQTGPVPYTAHLTISNESIATDGHSLRVAESPDAWRGVQIAQSFLKDFDNSKTYDSANAAATCTDFNAGSWRAERSITPAGCAIDIGKNGSIDCVVEQGKSSCGTLVNKIVKGKTFLIEFWAKGTGDLFAAAYYDNGLTGAVKKAGSYDLVNLSNASTNHTNFTPLKLSGSWQLYSLGPFDSGKFQYFDQNSKVFFYTKPNNNFFLDNLVIKQAQENITLVKDSWVVPSTCDTAPNGINSPQYYLGCEAYTDQNSKNHNLYQFSKLCSEKVVGCEMFYQTFQSESPYSEIHNASCVKGIVSGQTVDISIPQITTTPVDCKVNGKTYCTIPAGQGACTFDYDGTFDEKLPLDPSTGFGIMFGAETVVVPADQPVYIVDNGTADCSATSAGCQEVGKPKYSQDLSKVESFESAYFINDPDQYGDILCGNEALFCDEYSSTKDGNYYFKSPMDKQCEYKASVEIDGKKFSGWFRKGKSEPCYWTDADTKDGKFTPGTDTAYITSGDQVSIWKNGDTDYDGWVGACSAQQDLCSEFIDVVDTEGGLKKDGTSYYFINNDKLTQAATQGSSACNGKVSQKVGCALFNNRSKAELNYNASATYVLSTHADELLKKTPDVLVDPVSCLQDGGVFKDSNGKSVDLCKQRCAYQLASNDALTTSLSVKTGSSNKYLERSCLYDSDCPTLKSKNDMDVTGTCETGIVDLFKLSNDSNTVLKVTRDRSCSAWLACDSARTSFNERTNKYEPICDSIDLCVRGGAVGQTASCTQWDPRDPEILTDSKYSTRDVTWNGYELSGYAIPNQLPVELYDQFNLNPEKACMQNGKYVKKDGSLFNPDEVVVPVACNDDCALSTTCDPVDPDYRLVYNAGSCDSTNGNGGSCKVGQCSKTGSACSTQAECAGTENKCVIGSCRETKPAKDGLCTDHAGFFYDDKLDVCVDVDPNVLVDPNPCFAGDTNGCTGNQVCIESATTAVGKCFNNRCLTDIQDGDGNGFADPIVLTSALDQSCRGYPEVDSPYPSLKVVEQWLTPNMINGGSGLEPAIGFKTPTANPESILSKPYSYKTGYQDSKVCAVDPQTGQLSDCDCNYDKIKYGQGAVTLFESTGTNSAVLPPGLCTGGPFEGHTCDSNKDCTDYTNPDQPDAGTCLKKTNQDTLYGWSGYCIEKDSSIQLYASTNADDRACLTWLPVDQLSGATDLFAKYTSAGFEQKDTYFCAEIAQAYDFATSPSGDGVHCAVTKSKDCQGGLDKTYITIDRFKGDQPYESVYCPAGFFAVMAGCGKAAPGEQCVHTFVDDYPYFCVPKLSYHTEGDDAGLPCEPPKQNSFVKQKATDVWSSQDWEIPSQYDDLEIYLLGDVSGTNWNDIRPHYEDCKAKGIFKDTPAYNAYIANDWQLSRANAQTYPACQTLVQVARHEPEDLGQYNVAWTDRVWKNQTIPPITYQIDKDIFSYTVTTSPPVFGQAIDLTDKVSIPDPYPHRLQICPSGDIPTVANKCEVEDETPLYVNEAKAYYKFVDPSTIISCTDDSQCYQNNVLPTCNETSLGMCEGGHFTISCEGMETTWYQLATNEGLKTEIDAKCGIAVFADDVWKNCMQTFVQKVCKAGGGQCMMDSSKPSSSKTCDIGPNKDEGCSDDSDCRPLQCLTNVCQNIVTYKVVTKSGFDVMKDGAKRLQQLFAKSYQELLFDTSVYDFLSNDFNNLQTSSDTVVKVFTPKEPWISSPWNWDNRITGDAVTGDKPTPPKVWALGPCTGSNCREGKEGAITINDQDQGDVFGKTAKKITVSFFTAANSNQMPIRQIIVDWGDGKNTTPPWPTDSQSGSTASDNFYKNHRGLDNSGEPRCTSDANEFGLSPEACSASYVAFNHDYTCTTARVKELENDPRSSECKHAPDGRLLNSPCTDGESCFYQPRVHIKDNWGWCTGFCDAGSDGTNGCFAGTPSSENNECQVKVCPSEGDSNQCPDSNKDDSIVNPWVNYNGYVIIEPEV